MFWTWSKAALMMISSLVITSATKSNTPGRSQCSTISVRARESAPLNALNIIVA
ncbi:MAG TPA: hypothetical protein P5267_03385 [Patescibacteria group bacterium]|nr:hypothetical protein [Patescibacteria group bacterium]